MSHGKPTVAIVGTGRLGRVWTRSLSGADYPVLVSGRRPGSARTLARGLKRVGSRTRPADAVREAAIVLLAVSDAAIESVAEALAAETLEWHGKVVLHHAGALGPEPLESLAAFGAEVGVLHPLQALGRSSTAADLLVGSRARIEGSPAARRAARRLARDVGLVPLRHSGPWTADSRAAYHVAASLVSNDLVALLSVGIELLVQAGVERNAALGALGALAAGTLRQATDGGIAAALTGPVTRGDVETLRAQLGALEERDPDAAEAHRRLSLRLLDLVREHDPALDDRVAGRLRRALRLPSGGRRPKPRV